MLASSSDIAYSQYFCRGLEMTSEITSGEKYLSWGMETDAIDLDCRYEDSVFEDHDCYKNHIFKIQTDDNFARVSFDLKGNKTFLITFVSEFILQEAELTPVEETFFADYNPPLLLRDLNILNDNFLI